MKPAALLLTVLFAVAALSTVVWLGRYQGAIPSVPSVASDHTDNDVSEEESVLPIPKQGPYGKAVAEKVEHDFGAMMFGTKGMHVFTIKNEGEGPLRVKTGKTSCSQCTIGKVSREDDIPPGESVEMEIKWEIKNATENFRQWAEVFTTDPENKRLELTIVGRVDQYFHLIPEGEWILGDLPALEPKVFHGGVYSSIVDEIEIEKFECSNPLVSVTWEPTSPESVQGNSVKSAMKVSVTVAPGSPLGSFREVVNLTMTYQGGSVMAFQLVGQRFGPVEFKGQGWNPRSNTVVLGEFPATRGTKTKLNLYVRELEGELEVQAIEQKFNSVKFQINPVGKVVGKSKVYEVEMEILPGPSVKRTEVDVERIQLKLNHLGAKEFKFQVSYHSI